MWTWYQLEGEVWRGGAFIARGYAGRGEGVNSPWREDERDVGPVPVGRYTLGAPEPGHGGYALRLLPDAETRARIIALGRDPDSFLVHGDDLDPAPNSASKGCPILPRIIRVAMWESGDHAFEVKASRVESTPVEPVHVPAEPVGRGEG